MSSPERPLAIVFFASETGAEPVREWLLSLPKVERKANGEDILAVQYAWPVGKPLVDFLGNGLWEIRTRLANRIARTLFIVVDHEVVLLHGFIKKSPKTPKPSLTSRAGANANTLMSKTKNPHRGSDFREFLAADGTLADVEARALKRAISLLLQKALKESALSKSGMASRMHTSRAVIDRLLDPENPSLTLATLGKAAHVLGCRLRVELLPA